jgi:hypothetical protein
VFAYARQGLAESGVEPDTRDRFLAPIERRWEHQTTPSKWKLDRVRDALAAGASLHTAIEQMQRRYHERSVTHDSFAAWL